MSKIIKGLQNSAEMTYAEFTTYARYDEICIITDSSTVVNPINITSITGNGSVVTVLIDTPSNFSISDEVVITGTANYNGRFMISNVIDTSTFEYIDIVNSGTQSGIVTFIDEDNDDALMYKTKDDEIHIVGIKPTSEGSGSIGVSGILQASNGSGGFIPTTVSELTDTVTFSKNVSFSGSGYSFTTSNLASVTLASNAISLTASGGAGTVNISATNGLTINPITTFNTLSGTPTRVIGLNGSGVLGDATSLIPDDAIDITYDNAGSTLASTDVQGAIDELDGKVETNSGNISTNTGNISTNVTNISNNATAISTHTSDTVNPHSTSLDNLTDTNNIASATNGNILAFNSTGSKWEPIIYSAITTEERSAWTNILSSGVISGLEITVSSTTEVAIAIGHGHTIDRSVPTSPVITGVDIGSPIIHTAQNIGGASPIVYVYLNSSGNIEEYNFPDSTRKYQGLISLGVYLQDGVQVIQAIAIPNLAFDPISTFSDQYLHIGLTREDGNIEVNSGTLEISQNIGEYFSLAGNFYEVGGATNPNFLAIPATVTSSFTLTTPLSTVPSPVTNIDPNQYWNGATLTTIPTNDWTIQRIFQTANLELFIQYGQATYNQLGEAEEAYSEGNDPFTINPILKPRQNAHFLGALFVQDGETDLSNAKFKPSQAPFGLGALGGSGGANTVSSVFGRTGIIIAQSGDYSASLISYDNATSGLTATEVKSALDELTTLLGGQVDTVTSANTDYITVNSTDPVNPTVNIGSNVVTTDTNQVINSAKTIETNQFIFNHSSSPWGSVSSISAGYFDVTATNTVLRLESLTDDVDIVAASGTINLSSPIIDTGTNSVIGRDPTASNEFTTKNYVDGLFIGTVQYQGTWNASTNTPTLSSGVGTQGHYYVVNVAGSEDLDGETNWLVGDWAIFDGSVWGKVDNTNSSVSAGTNISVVQTGEDYVVNVIDSPTFAGAVTSKAGNGIVTYIVQNDSSLNVIEQMSDASGDGHLLIRSSTGVPRFEVDAGAGISGGYMAQVNGAFSVLGDATIGGSLDITSNDAQIIGGFGANTAGGFNDWNDASNARSGSGNTLLRSTGLSSNGPLSSGSDYWHPFSFEFDSKDGTGNLTQIGIPYGNTTQLGRIVYRSKYSGAFYGYREVVASELDGTYNLDRGDVTISNDLIIKNTTGTLRGTFSGSSDVEFPSVKFDSSLWLNGTGLAGPVLMIGTDGNGYMLQNTQTDLITGISNLTGAGDKNSSLRLAVDEGGNGGAFTLSSDNSELPTYPIAASIQSNPNSSSVANANMLLNISATSGTGGTFQSATISINSGNQGDGRQSTINFDADDYFFTNIAPSSDTAPVDADHLTRKDYVDSNNATVVAGTNISVTPSGNDYTVNVINDPTFGGTATIKNASGSSEFIVGDDTSQATDVQNGFKVNASSNGSLFIDHKTISGGAVNFRTGEGAETGNVHTFMEVDPTNGYVEFPNNVTINASEVEINVGDDADGIIDNNAGMRILKTSAGSLFYDHKTYTGGSINYRCGEGTERGNVHTFMQVDPTNGDVTFAGNVDVNAQLTSNALFKSKGATIIEDSVFQVNKTSAPHIAFNNSAGTSGYGLVGEQSGSINLDSYNGLDVELNSDNDVRIGATGDVNVTGNEINLNAPTNVDSGLTANSAAIKTVGGNSTLLVGDTTTTTTDNLTGFRILARETEGDLFIDHKTKSGDVISYRCGEGAQSASSHTFMKVDPTDGDVTFGANVNVNDGVGIYNNTPNVRDGFISVYTPTVDDFDAVRYAALKQNDTYVRLIAGWAGSGSGANELRIEVADSSGAEQITGVFYSDKFILNKGFQQAVGNTEFNVISRNNDNAPSLYVNNAGTGDIQVWQSDATQTGQGIVARMHNDGSLDLDGILNLASTTNASPSTGDIWRDATFITINDDLKVRSDKPILELLSTKDGTWTAGERKGAINFYGSDTSGGGPNVHAFIQAQTRDTFGAATELSFGVSGGGQPAFESLRLKASGALNYRPITNTAPEDGDVWRDSSDGKLKGRQGSVTSNLIGGGGVTLEVDFVHAGVTSASVILDTHSAFGGNSVFYIPNDGKTYTVKSIILTNGVTSTVATSDVNIRLYMYAATGAQRGLGVGTLVRDWVAMSTTGAQAVEYYTRSNSIDSLSDSLTNGQYLSVDLIPNFYSMQDTAVRVIIEVV